MFKHENARINVLGVAPRIVTDFGDAEVLPGEDERAAAIRIYRAWCKDEIEPDPSPTVVLHDVVRE
jgi:hypothetical protein